MNPCMNCGSDVGDENPPNASHCGNCPPWRCDDCEEMSSMANLCSCWTDLLTLTLADAKALFACDCDDGEPELSLDPEVSDGGQR